MRGFVFRVPRTEPKVRLVCLHCAGGVASTYKPWSNELPTWIEVCPFELSGRGTRFEEAAVADLPAVVDEVWRALDGLPDLPYALFGHSFGALVAFELAHHAITYGKPPMHLFAAAAASPQAPRRERIHDLPRERLIERLLRYGGIPTQVLDEPELIDLFLPAIRADFEMLETYVFRARPPLPCSITALVGTEDRTVDPDKVESWHVHASGVFRKVPIRGDHFFVASARHLVLDEIVADLSSLRA